MSTKRVSFAALALVAMAFTGPVGAADSAREGSYAFRSCQSGVLYTLPFSKTHSGAAYESTGTLSTTPPGGVFDRMSFHCVGFLSMLGGIGSNQSICEAVDRDGDKMLARIASIGPGMMSREVVSGSGKYEGMVSSGTIADVGQFPTIKPGTFQGCNLHTGTYRLK